MTKFRKAYWKNGEENAIDFLDSIPEFVLLEMMKPGDDLSDIIAKIEEKFDLIYNRRYKTDTGIFNSITNSEFEEYLSLRFNAKFAEETKYILQNIGS